MFRKLCRPLLLVVWLVGGIAFGQTIAWYCTVDKSNITSDEQPMDAAFRFELGVFKGNFIPTSTNKELWAENWVAAQAQRAVYIVGSKSFTSQYALESTEDNAPPFTADKEAYVWGFRGNASSGEWILFRHSLWIWPAYTSGNMDPNLRNWNAANATPVLGSIHSTGSPFLMQSAAVTNAAPPTTTWEQWQTDYLSNEPLKGPNDDPDHDGVSNLMEYVFGLPPKQAGAPPQTPVSFMQVSGQNYLQISIPRRIDHKSATLVVEVSSDLHNWSSGSAVVEMSSTPTAWVVRDATPSGPGLPRRFMRLGATLP